MVSRPCDRNRLEALLDDPSSEGDQTEMARHIETCPNCRRQLETMAAEAGWWADARQFLSPQECDDDAAGDDAAAVDDASLTQSGVVAGTPQYMAPEQVQGQPIDHRSDLFSLGSVIYAMCTGRSPFRAEMTMAVLRRICESRPRPIREVNPDIPGWLAEIVDKLLEKDPGDRFQSADELADLLGRHLKHLQHPSAVPMPERIKGRCRRRSPLRIRKVAKAIGVVLVLLLAGLGVAELVGITNLVGFATVVLSDRTAESSARSVGQASSTVSDASGPAITVVPSDLLHWDDGLEHGVDDVRQRVQKLEGYPNPQGDTRQSPDASAVLDLELRELERKVDDRWP